MMRKKLIKAAAITAFVATALTVSVAVPASAQEYFGWINGKNCGTTGYAYTTTRSVAVDDEHQIKNYSSTAVDRATFQNLTGQVQTHNNWTSFRRSEWAWVRTNQGSYLSRDHLCDY
ncbi:hypothetical protein [Microbacterium telephonicum]|uniref:Lactococcin 972 family bacteriocin n=1 Tax=Microbacterium telephonicum TaxID=1714841 RepID=A0A498C499_9MICO|nr:hypothetical protein [Microbacterium telephonicum]RLK49336.1 hypothetical protein C7474_1479 [Microbacterium telephonicum]